MATKRKQTGSTRVTKQRDTGSRGQKAVQKELKTSKTTAETIDNAVDLRARLREDIVGCVLTPGQRLKFEELRSRYDAGIGSLREALLQLESDGLVITESNRGFCVAPVSVADLEDITERRIEIERKALTDSITHGDDAWEAQIIAALHMLLKLDSHSSVWEERHRRFHDALVAACRSQWLKRFRRILWDQSQRYRKLSLMQSRTPGRSNEHRELMEIVIARDVQGAVALMEKHIRNTAENTREWLAIHGPQMAETDFSRSESESKSARA